ncbi:MAG: serine/threonine protein phosphatase [Desulfovibrionaceae bacterium]|nr:serine/threonine protein phosphatase [Desulfovibrionaceae bacterium]
MPNFFAPLWRILSLTILLFCVICTPNIWARSLTVYDNQGPTTEKELLAFLKLVPEFRTWARQTHEEAHPTLTHNRPDFAYSKQAASWVQAHGFEPRRFFCVMGRMAAALVIVAEGADTKGARPKDMPEVSEGETALVRKHLGRMLQVSGATHPNTELTVPQTKPTLPKR